MVTTSDIKELEKEWMKLYLNLMILRSNDPKAMAELEKMQQKLAETNEEMTTFFEKIIT